MSVVEEGVTDRSNLKDIKGSKGRMVMIPRDTKNAREEAHKDKRAKGLECRSHRGVVEYGSAEVVWTVQHQLGVAQARVAPQWRIVCSRTRDVVGVNRRGREGL